VIEGAGPGEPGQQAPDFRLRRSRTGFPTSAGAAGRCRSERSRVRPEPVEQALGYDGRERRGGGEARDHRVKGVY